jgi:hypothetical protein
MVKSGDKVMDQIMRWLFQRRFLVLLLALGLLVIVYPVMHGAFSTRLLLDALLSIVFLAAFLMVFSQGRFRTLALFLAVPTIVGAWIDYVLPGLPRIPLQVSFHLVAALFFGFTVTCILGTIHREKGVSADAIYGAFCGYVVVGLAFGHLYCVAETLTPGSFQGSPQLLTQLHEDDRHHVLLAYFSLVTLTSVGYGDIIPGSGPVRSLAVVEAILGQFYIAVLIGELIGKRVSQAVSGQQSDPAKSAGSSS